MRMRTLVLIALLTGLCASQNPFMDGGVSTGDTTETAVEDTRANPPFWYPLVVWQKQINDTLSSALQDLREGFSLSKVLLVFGVSLLYSLVHTAGPGHGKLLLGTYFLTSDVQRRKSDAAIAGGVVSLTHIGTAVLLSLFLWLVLHTLSMSSQREMAAGARRAGGVLVLLTGLAMVLVTAFKGRVERLFNQTVQRRAQHLSLYGVAMLSGIVPCPLAWFVLVFSISYGIYAYGIVSVIAMAIGAAITVGSTGFVVLVAKERALGFLKRDTMEKLAGVLRYAGGIVLLAIGVVMIGSG